MSVSPSSKWLIENLGVSVVWYSGLDFAFMAIDCQDPLPDESQNTLSTNSVLNANQTPEAWP